MQGLFNRDGVGSRGGLPRELARRCIFVIPIYLFSIRFFKDSFIGWLDSALGSPYYFTAWCQDHEWIVALVLVMPIGLLVKAGQWAKRLDREDLEEVKQNEIRDLHARVVSGQEPRRDLLLYLRPFSLDPSLNVPNPFYSVHMLSPTGHYLQGRYKHLEAVLTEALWNEGTVVGIGGSDVAWGTAKYWVEQDLNWWPLFETFSQKATLILMVPGASEGCKHELMYLARTSLIYKTVFVMPPTKLLAISKDMTWSLYWESVGNVFSECGITVPPLRKHGALFRFGPMQTVTIRPLPGAQWFSRAFTPARLRRLLLTLKDGRNDRT